MLEEQKPLQQIIDINRLRFDPNNPRLPSRLNGANHADLLEWMLKDASIFELMYSIGEQGYFDGEPLLVARTEIEGEYLVVEGNRRLAALKLLQDPLQVNIRQTTLSKICEEAEYKPTTVPCIVYSVREEILDHLGFRHVTGVKSWGPLAKARYLQDLSAKYIDEPAKQKYQLLAKSIGSRSDYVKRMLAGLELYDIIEEEDYYDIEDLNEVTLSFSLVTTALANSNIVDFLGLESSQDLGQLNLKRKNLKQLTEWIFKGDAQGRTRLGESRNFRYLNKVVASPEALSQFISGRSLHEALLYTDEPLNAFRDLVTKSKSNLQDAQNRLYLIREGLNRDDMIIATDIGRMARDVRITVEGRLEETRDSDSGFDDE